jgi:ribose transport system permease protein
MATASAETGAATGGGPSAARARAASAIQRQGALVALVLLVTFAALRYDGFFTADYLLKVVLASPQIVCIGLIALGMTFVIMLGEIDLSVGAVAAMAAVIAAENSGGGIVTGVGSAVLAGLAFGVMNGVLIAYLRLPSFIVTLATLLAARGLALILSDNATVAVDYTSNYLQLANRQVLGLPVPLLILVVAYVVGVVLFRFARFGRHVLAVGGNQEAAALMGLPVPRIKLIVFALSGALAGLAGAVLTAKIGSGAPLEAAGWELSAIAAVVVGGTLLTGGLGSVAGTLVGVLLLGLIFTIINFENGEGVISLNSYWQTVVRGVFLLLVVVLQNRLARRTTAAAGHG